MLAADKLQLQTTLKQQATALKEKEFKLHHENLMTVGTQAAVLAGLDCTMLIELTPAHDHEWGMIDERLWFLPRLIKFIYYISIVSAFCCNILVVGQTTMLSVLGASLALRGPDGSMMVATDGLFDERKSVFKSFAYGLSLTLCAAINGVWLILPPETAFVSMLCIIFTAKKMREHYHRVRSKFEYAEEDSVDFSDFFDAQPIRSLGLHLSSKARNGYSQSLKASPHTSSRNMSSSDEESLNKSLATRRRKKGKRISNDLQYTEESATMVPLMTV